MTPDNSFEYSAKTDYVDRKVGEEYEKNRYSGWLGRWRNHIEQRAVRTLLKELPEGSHVLDCPCGIGRWWPALLERNVSGIKAVDISTGMLDLARQRAAATQLKQVEFQQVDATHLPFPDNSFDYVFSHALMKHLPVPLQYRVLAEFSRVARHGVVCSFGVFSHLNYGFWRVRKLREDYPVTPVELEWMAHFSKLSLQKSLPCTTPLGVARIAYFKKTNSALP